MSSVKHGVSVAVEADVVVVWDTVVCENVDSVEVEVSDAVVAVVDPVVVDEVVADEVALVVVFSAHHPQVVSHWRASGQLGQNIMTHTTAVASSISSHVVQQSAYLKQVVSVNDVLEVPVTVDVAVVLDVPVEVLVPVSVVDLPGQDKCNSDVGTGFAKQKSRSIIEL
jgi:non-ribosomal peptide synthetase component F